MQAGDHLSDRYRLDTRLANGGMGEVWRGYDVELGRAVALKVLLQFDAPGEQLQRFRREASIGAKLQHPGITVVHDIGYHDDRLFIVMELLEGADLTHLLARSPGGLAVSEAIALALQAAEALAAAHDQQVVHRDLKPANLFLLSGGRLKICDFGIARVAGATDGLTVTGRPFGTPPYMAPEQWRGEHVDARCDLYALGCVLYALLIGAPPFSATEGAWALMLRHLEEVPPSLHTVRNDVPVEIDQLVASLLAKNPADRPAIGDVIDRLTATGCNGAAEGTPLIVAQNNRVPVVLPALGKRVVEGSVARWLVRPGGRVEVEQPLVVVSTDKVDTELPSPASGTLASITVAENQSAPIGATLAIIHTTRPAQMQVSAPTDAYITPLVRKVAAELDVDLASVRGTGVGGRIRKQDVRAAAQTKNFPHAP
ncbi:protein kinase [Streptomyces sp. NPDC046853]|uniref:protein kinase domain-containing protein n=1 Tax=Streptomyces sp. NPDC046853 TaxID=3154920 RepID=UPI00340BE0AD